jgi:hypothetical protein
MTPALLLAVGFAAGVLGWLGLVAVPKRVGAVEAIRSFAARHGARLVGSGAGEPIRVVGVVAGRTFTLLYEASWMHGDVLLLAVDCASDAVGPQVRGEVVAEAGDEALAVRVRRPPADLLDRLDVVLAGLVEMAASLERERPAAPGGD